MIMQTRSKQVKHTVNDSMEHLVDLMRTDTSEDAPPTAIASVLSLFRSRTVPASAAQDSGRDVLIVFSLKQIVNEETVP
jgi:hypothetical protein